MAFLYLEIPENALDWNGGQVQSVASYGIFYDIKNAFRREEHCNSCQRPSRP